MRPSKIAMCSQITGGHAETKGGPQHPQAGTGTTTENSKLSTIPPLWNPPSRTSSQHQHSQLFQKNCNRQFIHPIPNL